MARVTVPASLTYLYCLVASGKSPRLRGVPAGLPGTGPIRALEAGHGLWLIVADAQESELGEAAIAKGIGNLDWVSRRAVGHEAVVEHFLTAAAVVPMQLFTIFTSDERALDHVRRSRTRIDRVVKRITGQHEWGLRVTWDEQAARQAVEASHAAPARRRVTGGAAYLARKRDLLDVSRTQLTAARTAATRLFRQMSKLATAASRQTNTEQAAPGSRLLLAAAFLVPVKTATPFRQGLRAQMRALRSSGLVVSLTGPWPPYNFIAGASASRGPR